METKWISPFTPITQGYPSQAQRHCCACLDYNVNAPAWCHTVGPPWPQHCLSHLGDFFSCALRRISVAATRCPATGVHEHWHDSTVSVLQQTRGTMMLGGVSPVLSLCFLHLFSLPFIALGFRVLRCRTEMTRAAWGQCVTHQENSWMSNGQLGSSFAPSWLPS